jgi:signal transduction histidine kinase
MRNLTILSLLIFCFCYNLKAENINIDSLKNILRLSITNDTAKVKILLDIGRHYINEDFEVSMNYGYQALSLAKKKGRKKDVADVYLFLSINHLDTHISDDSILYYNQKVLDYAMQLGDEKLKMRGLNMLGSFYSRSTLYEKSINTYLQVLDIAEASRDTNMINLVLSNIGVVFFYQEQYQKAEKYFNRSLALAESIENSEMIARVSSNLGTLYSNDNKLDMALVYLHKALEINRKSGSKYDLAIVLHNLGFNYKNNKQYELAEKYAKESYNISLDLKLITGQSNNLKLLGNIAFAQKKYNKAIELGQSALTLIEESNQNKNKLQIYFLLQKAYAAIKKYDLAYQYLSNHQMINDSISNENTTKITNELETKYQVQQKEAENKLLKAEQKANQKTIQSRNISIIAAILGLLLLGLLVGINYRSKIQTTKYNEQLEKIVTERTTELAQANDELRTFSYIASHDIKEPIRNIGNFIGLIQRKLPNEVKQDLSDYFEIITFSVKQLYILLEDFAKYLSLSKDENVELDNVNLNDVMYNVLHGLSATTEKYQGQVIYQNLPTIISNSSLLFFVLKNLIENGLKYNHSEKPIVGIDYQETANFHQIIIADNGIGIESEYHEKVFEMFKRLHNREEYEGSGVGLAIVKLVIEKLKGHIKIESELNEGTSIIINLPK